MRWQYYTQERPLWLVPAKVLRLIICNGICPQMHGLYSTTIALLPPKILFQVMNALEVVLQVGCWLV